MIFIVRRKKEMREGLKRILIKLRKLISRIIFDMYQRERKDFEELGNNAEEIKEYNEDPNNKSDLVAWLEDE